MDLKLYAFLLYSICIASCVSKQNHKFKKEDFCQGNCIYDVCFYNKLVLIDSLIDQTNYNGLMLKIYDVHFDKEELKMNDSLLKKGYKKFPLGWYEVPHLLNKYISLSDTGYYKYDNSNGDRYIILDYSTHKFILYDQGLLIDLYRADSLKGKFN